MKSEDLYKAIGEIGEDLLARSEAAELSEENIEQDAPGGLAQEAAAAKVRKVSDVKTQDGERSEPQDGKISATPENPPFQVVNGGNNQNNNQKRPRRVVYTWIAAAAACLLVLAGGARALRNMRMGSTGHDVAEAAKEEVYSEAAMAEEAKEAGIDAAEAPMEEAPMEMEEAAEETADEEEAAPAAEEPAANDASYAAGAAENEGVVESEDTGTAWDDWQDEPWQKSEENSIKLVSSSIINEPSEQNTTDYADYDARDAEKISAADTVFSFEKKSAAAILGDTGSTDNKLYSPIALYTSAAMLAEITQGNAREEILSALGTYDPAEIREAAGQIIRRASTENNNGVSRLENALWLRKGISYKITPLLRLGEWYGTSVFSGKMGSEEYNMMLREWLNAGTGNMLEKETAAESFDDLTILALTTALYYKTPWMEAFDGYNTQQEVFHTPSGERTVDMMHTAVTESRYLQDNDFSAVALPLKDGRKVFLFLPKEGISAETFAAGTEWLDEIREWGSWKDDAVIDLKVPHFDITEELDLQNAFSTMGITSVFTDWSAFSDVLEGEYALSEARQVTRLSADEEGITGASYVAEEAAAGELEKKVEMIFDRPFCFAVADQSGFIWFAGVVNEP